MQFDESFNMVIVEFHDLTDDAQTELIMRQEQFSKSHNLRPDDPIDFEASGIINVNFED
jgi:hypothetical protein